MLASKVGFFSSGMIRACFKAVGNIPEESDMFVMVGSSSGRHCLKMSKVRQVDMR